MKHLLQKLLPLFLILCFLCGCESDPLASRPWIKGYASRPDSYDPADYTDLYFNSYNGLCITNAEEETLRYDGDYLYDGISYLYYGDMKIYRTHFAIGFGAIIELEVLSSRYYMFEYSQDPGNHLSVSTETDHLIVEASEIEKAVLYTSRSPGAVCAALDGDLSEFSVRCYLYGEHRQLILTGSGKNHVEVRYENGTLVAEGEGLEYSVTEEAA